MTKITAFPLITGLFVLFSSIPATANPLNNISQLFYPPPNNPQTFMVVGKGKATQKADTAVLELSLSSAAIGENTVTSSLMAQKETPLELQVKAIVNALTAIGVKNTDISILYPQNNSGSFSFPFPIPTPTSTDETKIIVTVLKPTHPRLQQIITAAGKALDKDQPFTLARIGIRYSVGDCQALQRETYKNAIKDAQNRASAIADALNAQLNPIPSVAEPFYGIILPEECATGEGNLFSSSTVPYDANAPIEVEVSKDIFVTFSVR